MHIEIYPCRYEAPDSDTFKLKVDAHRLPMEFPTYDAAVSVANSISKHAIVTDGVVTIDYSRCLSS